jgi:hypothetical protein
MLVLGNVEDEHGRAQICRISHKTLDIPSYLWYIQLSSEDVYHVV